MKKLLCLGVVCVIFCCFAACAQPEVQPVTTIIVTTAPQVVWRWPYGWDCAQRNRELDAYRPVEVSGNDLIMSTEGSKITGYYDENQQLQIMEIIVYREVGRSIVRFYPIEDIVAITSEDIWYTVPFMEATADDEYRDGTARMSLENGQLYYYIDEFEPMLLSDNIWYAEIYAKAVVALGEADANAGR